MFRRRNLSARAILSTLCLTSRLRLSLELGIYKVQLLASFLALLLGLLSKSSIPSLDFFQLQFPSLGFVSVLVFKPKQVLSEAVVRREWILHRDSSFYLICVEIPVLHCIKLDALEDASDN